MGWLTTGRKETLTGKAKRKAGEKIGDAVSAAKPSNIRANRHVNKGGNLCIGCSKPVRGGNVHKKCAGKVASNYTSLMAKELAQQKQREQADAARAARAADKAKRDAKTAKARARAEEIKAKRNSKQPEPKKKSGGWW